MNIKVNVDKVKKWREERCWSQDYVAEISGISLRTIQRIESGATTSSDSIASLAAAFGVDVMALTLDINAEVEKTVEREEIKKFLQFKMSFGIHLVSYVLVITILLLINLAKSPENLWILWPAVGWGIGLVAHAATVYLVSYISKMEKQIKDIG